jgi:hypothetical protein
MPLQPFGHWPLFRYLNPIHSQQDFLHGGSVRRKAATYTQDNIIANIHAFNRILTTNTVFERAKTFFLLDRVAPVIGKVALKELKRKVFLCVYGQLVLS